MEKYNSQEFLDALNKKMNNKNIPTCPYCGGTKFVSTENYAIILAGDNTDKKEISKSIPSGMVICEKCGHIEFFAFGSLGLMPKKDGDKNG